MKTFELLGRTGDIIGLLPLLRHFGQRDGYRPRYLVAKEFAGLLEGCSYVEPVEWPYDWRDARLAWQVAHGEPANGEILNCTVYARDFNAVRRCHNFQRDAWFNAGADVPWGSLPLVFDRRVAAREDALLSRLSIDKRPLILTSFSGTSAPFTGGPAVLERLTREFPGHRILDLSAFRAERFFDLLALFERAEALVCTDSAPLHLARAVPDLPVCALIPEHPAPKGEWCRAEWTPQQVFRCLHGQVASRLDELCERIRVPGSAPEIVHVYSWYDAGLGLLQNDERRIGVAQASWARESAGRRWEHFNVQLENLKRDATITGDPDRLPFLNDMLSLAAAKCRPQDVVVFTNADTGLSPGVTGWILDAVGRTGSCFAHRWDFFKPLDSPLVSEMQCQAGKWYPGSDLFAFSPAWWHQHGPEYPDMILGREAPDMVLRQMIKRTHGAELHHAIWHEKHPSKWEQHGAEKLAGNIHNVTLAKAYLSRWRGIWDDWQTPQNLALLRQHPTAA